MKYFVVALIVLLAVVHQDFWWWDDRTVVFGFIPIGLAWHMGISLMAGLTGWLAVSFCWPRELDELQQTTVDAGEPEGVRGPADGEGR